MSPGRIASADEWLTERRQLLIKEKELTRLREQLIIYQDAAKRAECRGCVGTISTISSTPRR